MFKVIKYFQDLQDGNHDYLVGDEFPHEGLEVTNDRLIELSTANNLQHTPLIEMIEEPVNEEGEPVNEEGEPVNGEGEPVNEEGEPVNEEGEPVNEEVEKAAKKKSGGKKASE